MTEETPIQEPVEFYIRRFKQLTDPEERMKLLEKYDVIPDDVPTSKNLKRGGDTDG